MEMARETRLQISLFTIGVIYIQRWLGEREREKEIDALMAIVIELK